MELRFSPTSPYVRKVLACAIELGIEQKLALNNTSPYDPDGDLRGINPLSKVPCLVVDEGPALFDSPVICEYLAAQAGDNTLFPPAGQARWDALRQQAMADGILDAALLRRYEMDRPEETRSSAWTDRQTLAMTSALDVFERECNEWNTDITVGKVATACTLGYLDLRFADEDWREGRKSLEAWYGFFAERESMKRTVPIVAS